MASRNGLNPKIKGSKGVGFGRALPSVFGFGNGIQPNGSNNFLAIPNLLGKSLGSEFSIEFWFNYSGVFNFVDAIFELKTTSGDMYFGFQNNRIYGLTPTGEADISLAISAIKPNKNHIILNFSDTGCDFSLNYSDPSGYRMIGFGNSFGLLTGEISLLNIFAITVNSWYGSQFYDELRIYEKNLTSEQIIYNYNNGIGNNPSITEDLLVWYQFEKFENIDFSAAQDGTNILLGLKDYSGKNNHGQPINMDTNPSSNTFVLKTF